MSNLARVLIAAALLALACIANASSSVLVLDFGLNDDTLLPRIPAELERTAAVAPNVRQRLQALGHVTVETAQTPALREAADAGYRYLVDHPQAAAELGVAAGARWVAVGRVNKPSFLFAYFVVDLVDATTGRVVAHVETSPRGGAGDRDLQRRAAERLAEEIHAVLVAQTNTLEESTP